MISTLLGIVAVVAGAIYGMDDRYAPRWWAEKEIAGLQQQYRAQRLNDVEVQIINLERARERRRLSPVEEQLRLRLYSERCQHLVALQIVKDASQCPRAPR